MFLKICFYLAFCSLAIVAGCAHSKDFPQHYKHDQIHFGQGGGFTGMLTYYALLEDGRLYQRDMKDSSFTQVDTWKHDFVTQMFSNYKLFRFDTIDHYEPGDIYYFIEYHSSDKPIHRIAWGRPGFKPENNIVTYYNLLYKSTKSKS